MSIFQLRRLPAAGAPTAEQTGPLLALPDELLELVLRDPAIPGATLLAMAKMSRRLFGICLSAYLSHQGIENPEEQCDIILREEGPTLAKGDILSALHLAFFITKINRLSCSFPKYADLNSILLHMQRLESLLRRLSVTTVVLNFHPAYCRCKAGKDQVLQQWSDAVGSLLSTILERGCVSLAVNGMRYMVHSFGYKTWMAGSRILLNGLSIRARIAQALRPKDAVLKGVYWQFYRNPSYGSRNILTRLSSAAYSTTTLRHLIVGSDSLLLPPVLQWTQSTLCGAPIEHITIVNVRLEGRELWAVLMRLISQSAPRLPKLTIDNVRTYSLSEFNRGLSSLKFLSSLSIGRLYPQFESLYDVDRRISIMEADINQVTELRASAEWIRSSTYIGRYDHPSLRSLTIVHYQVADHFVAEPAWKGLLRTLSSKNPSYPVTLEVIGDSSMIQWMEREHLGGPASAVKCVSAITLLFETAMPTIPANTQPHNRFFAQFTNLRRLVINATEPPLRGGPATQSGFTIQTTNASHPPTDKPRGWAISASIYQKLEYFEFEGKVKKQIARNSAPSASVTPVAWASTN